MRGAQSPRRTGLKGDAGLVSQTVQDYMCLPDKHGRAQRRVKLAQCMRKAYKGRHVVACSVWKERRPYAANC
jgi:hypothetical protein